MSINAKSVVSNFYMSDFFNELDNVKKYLHPEMELFWNARTGYSHMNREDILTLMSSLLFLSSGSNSKIIGCWRGDLTFCVMKRSRKYATMIMHILSMSVDEMYTPKIYS